MPSQNRLTACDPRSRRRGIRFRWDHLARATRHEFYDMASAEKAMVVGFHFTFPSIGHVEKDGTKYRLVPIAWNPLI